MADEALNTVEEAQRIAEEAEGGVRRVEKGWGRWVVPAVAIAWSCFQLAVASFLLLDTIVVRAIHLAFALLLVYLTHPFFRRPRTGRLGRWLSVRDRFPLLDVILAVVAAALALYIVLDYDGISQRQGIPLTRDLLLGWSLVLLLLEAARRALGPMLPCVVLVFMLYCFFGPYMPGVLAFKGTSVARFMGQITLSSEGIYSVPLDVSATIVFLFVLFGAMLEHAGAGKYFVDLANSLLGGFRGGPAKAAVLASGLTGMVSGSSIANTVTTGTFTIPLMKKTGYPAHKAAAIEVACSTNGQLMPPIMGAAAFIMAEYCGTEYVKIIRAAFIPAVASYAALMYITHLEACKLGLRGIPRDQRPRFRATLIPGLHYLIPIATLITELVVMRHSPQLAAFRAICVMAVLIPIEQLVRARAEGRSWQGGLQRGGKLIVEALASGGKNMMGIGVAVGTAGIIVGAVNLGLGGILTEVIEVISGGNFVAILIITAIASLILGMGLPTTANYIVMASLTAPIIVTLGARAGLEIPLVAAHLFVFFFGILADDTPPVGLAAYAASAIAKSDPIKTGLQGFMYDIRTALLPFMFIFNTELLLLGVDTVWEAVWIFAVTVVALFAFAALTQGYFRRRNRWYEGILLAGITFVLLRADLVGSWLAVPMSTLWVRLVALGLFAALAFSQRPRLAESAC
jgi:TRAP transporter 4TM/12TM fusion protein